MTRPRATKTATIKTYSTRRATTTLGTSVQTTLAQKFISTATTASAGTHIAETDLGIMGDGVRSITTIIMKMEIEIATGSAMIMAIGITGAGTENLAEAVAERCQAQRHGALIAPLGHPLSDLSKLGTPSVSVGVPDSR